MYKLINTYVVNSNKLMSIINAIITAVFPLPTNGRDTNSAASFLFFRKCNFKPFKKCCDLLYLHKSCIMSEMILDVTDTYSNFTTCLLTSDRFNATHRLGCYGCLDIYSLKQDIHLAHLAECQITCLSFRHCIFLLRVVQAHLL
jgi:hypothetical protein